MRTLKIAETAASDVSETTLKLGPVRLLTFLQGVVDPAIHAQLSRVGWSTGHLEQAWSLLTELKAASVSASAPEPNPVADAIASCEQWQATGLVRVRALLLMTLPSIAAFMFHDFEAGEGTAAVLNVATFLQRRKELEMGANRKDSRKADQEALRIMDETGVTKSAVKHLEAMIAMVQSASVADAPAEPSSALDVTRADVLRRIYACISTWSEVARTVITRRDQRIRLGLAKRRPRKTKGESKEASPVATSPADPSRQASRAPFDEADEPAPDSRAA